MLIDESLDQADLKERCMDHETTSIEQTSLGSVGHAMDTNLDRHTLCSSKTKSARIRSTFAFGWGLPFGAILFTHLSSPSSGH